MTTLQTPMLNWKKLSFNVLKGMIAKPGNLKLEVHRRMIQQGSPGMLGSSSQEKETIGHEYLKLHLNTFTFSEALPILVASKRGTLRKAALLPYDSVLTHKEGTSLNWALSPDSLSDFLLLWMLFHIACYPVTCSHMLMPLIIPYFTNSLGMCSDLAT